MAGCACARWLQLSGAGQGVFDNARPFLLGLAFWQWLAVLAVAVQGALKRAGTLRISAGSTATAPASFATLCPPACLFVRSFTPLPARPRAPSRAIHTNGI